MSSGPLLCYRELIPPTGVDISVFFIAADSEEYLLTAASSSICLYKVQKSQLLVPFLVQVLQSNVFGKPQDVAILSSSLGSEDPKTSGHKIVMTFDMGKVTVLAFDPFSCTLTVVLAFNAEENAIGVGSDVHGNSCGRSRFAAAGSIALVDIDVASSTACVLVYGQQFFFIPLRQLPFDLHNAGRGQGPGYHSGFQKDSLLVPKHFVIDICQSLYLLGPVLDFCFVCGYGRPTIAVLQEYSLLPIGHAAKTMHTCCVSLLAIDVDAKSATLIWRQKKLPHDSLSLIPLSHPALNCGVAVVSMNAILLVSQEGIIGVATNGFAGTTVSPHIKLQPSTIAEGVELDASRWVEADDCALVGSLKDGRILMANILLTPEAVSLMDVKIECMLLASSIHTSSFSVSTRKDMWFLGSRQSDCLLLSVEKSADILPLLPSSTQTFNSPVLTTPMPAAKRQRRLTRSGMKGFPSADLSLGQIAEMETEEMKLYNSTLMTTVAPLSSANITYDHHLATVGRHVHVQRFHVTVADTVAVLGTVLDASFCANDETLDHVDELQWDRVGMPLPKLTANPASAYIVDREAKDALQLSIGLDAEGSLCRVARGMRLSKLATRAFPGALAAFSVLSPNSACFYSLLLMSFPDRTRGFYCNTDEGNKASSVAKGTTTSGSSASGSNGGPIVADIAIKEVPIGEMGFIASDSTIATAYISDTLVVQVVRQGARLINISSLEKDDDAERHVGFTGEAVQDVLLTDSLELGGLGGLKNEYIVHADICKEWVVLVSSLRVLYLLEYDSADDVLVIRHIAKYNDDSNSSAENLAASFQAAEADERSSHSEVLQALLVDQPVNASLFYAAIEAFDASSADKCYVSNAFPVAANGSNPPQALRSSSAVLPGKLSRQTSGDEFSLLSGKFGGRYNVEEPSALLPGSRWKSKQYAEETHLYGGALTEEDVVDRRLEDHSTWSCETDVTSKLPLVEKDSEASHNQPMNKSLETSTPNGCVMSNSSHDMLSPVGKVANIDSFSSDNSFHTPKTAPPSQSEAGVEEKEKKMVVVDAIEDTTTSPPQLPPVMHVLIIGRQGTVTIVRLSDMQCMMRTHAASLLPQLLPLQRPQLQKQSAPAVSTNQQGTVSMIGANSEGPDGLSAGPMSSGRQGAVLVSPKTPHAGAPVARTTSAHAPGEAPLSSDHVIVDARLFTLQSTSSSDTLGTSSRLCLVVVLDCGDVGVYYLNDINSKARPNEYSRCFVKVEHSVVTRRRRRRGKKKSTASFATFEGSVVDSSSSAGISNALTSCTRFNEGSFVGQRIVLVRDVDDRLAAFVSGARPVIITCEAGLPIVVPLGLPELPFANGGNLQMVPFVSGDVRGIAALWSEFDELQEGGGTSTAAVDAKRQAVLGLYQEVPGLKMFPGGVTSTKKVRTGMTTHRQFELLARTDDRTEQALLRRKTYILSCSTEVKVPFTASVLSEEEKKKEEDMYDRFFPDLTSFCQPDKNIGASPYLTMRQHKIAIMQNGTVVDEHILPLGEHVLDIEPIYLSPEVATTIPAVIPLGQPFVMTKKTRRVYIAACTSVEDKHGEDTQGEGRLLFFGLDYAQFHDDSNSGGGGGGVSGLVDEKVEEEKVLVDGAEDSAHTAGNQNSSMASAVAAAAAALGGSVTMSATISTSGAVPVIQFKTSAQMSAEQSKFLSSIQPKLKLLWTGPGPASVVKQLGEFILSTVAATVFIYKLNPETSELEQVAFHFAKFFIASVSIIKNFIIIADVGNSVEFLAWREEHFSLVLLSKDADARTVLTTAVIHDGSDMGIIVGDNEGNLQLIQYDPSPRRRFESKDGLKLLTLANFHLGADATVLVSHTMLTSPNHGMAANVVSSLPAPPLPPPPPMPIIPSMSLVGSVLPAVPPPPPPPGVPPPSHATFTGMRGSRQKKLAAVLRTQPFGQRYDKLTTTRSCTVVGTIDGGLGMLLPLDERTYRRLALLQQIMGMAVPTSCALNPREFRTLKASRFLADRKAGILDGTLLWKFVSLDTRTQDDLAAAMGISADVILENLLELDLASSFF